MARKTKAENKTALRGRMFVALLQAQKNHPTLRIGQIIDNAMIKGDGSPGLYFASDEDLVKALEAFAVSHSR